MLHLLSLDLKILPFSVWPLSHHFTLVLHLYHSAINVMFDQILKMQVVTVPGYHSPQLSRNSIFASRYICYDTEGRIPGILCLVLW